MAKIKKGKGFSKMMDKKGTKGMTGGKQARIDKKGNAKAIAKARLKMGQTFIRGKN